MYNKKQRIAAIAGLILIFLLLAGLILSAIFDKNGLLFKAFLFAVIAVPILTWIYIWIYGRMTGKDTIADFKRGRTDLYDGSSDAADALNESAASDNDGSESITVSKNPHLRNQ